MKQYKNYIPFILSLLLHLAVLLSVTWNFKPEPKGDGEEPVEITMVEEKQKDKGSDLDIAPKPPELPVLEKPELLTEEDVLGDMPKTEPMAEECAYDSWYGGIGIEEDYLTGRINVIAEGYPADLAGLKVGDIIKVVSSAIGPEIRGEPGTKVKITVLRPSTSEILNFEITRGKICTVGKKPKQ